MAGAEILGGEVDGESGEAWVILSAEGCVGLPKGECLREALMELGHEGNAVNLWVGLAALGPSVAREGGFMVLDAVAVEVGTKVVGLIDGEFDGAGQVCREVGVKCDFVELIGSALRAMEPWMRSPSRVRFMAAPAIFLPESARTSFMTGWMKH